MSIFKQVKYATLSFDKYPELLKNKLSKVIFFALFFIIIFSITYSLIPFAYGYSKTKGFDNFVQKYIPKFEVRNDDLIIKEYKKVPTSLNITFIFDPNQSSSITSEDKKDTKGAIIKITPKLIITPLQSLDTTQFLKLFNIKNNEDLNTLKPIILASCIISIVILSFSFSMSNITFLLIFFFLISFLVKLNGVNMSKEDIFKLTVYINTAPFILKFIFFLLSMSMPSYIYLGVVVAYLNMICKVLVEQNPSLKITN